MCTGNAVPHPAPSLFSLLNASRDRPWTLKHNIAQTHHFQSKVFNSLCVHADNNHFIGLEPPYNKRGELFICGVRKTSLLLIRLLEISCTCFNMINLLECVFACVIEFFFLMFSTTCFQEEIVRLDKHIQDHRGNNSRTWNLTLSLIIPWHSGWCLTA